MTGGPARVRPGGSGSRSAVGLIRSLRISGRPAQTGGPRRSSTPSTCWSWTVLTCAGNRWRSARQRSRASCVRAGSASVSTSTSSTTADYRFFSTPAGSGARASSPSGWDRATGPAVHPTGPSSRTRRHQPLGARRKRIGAGDIEATEDVQHPTHPAIHLARLHHTLRVSDRRQRTFRTAYT